MVALALEIKSRFPMKIAADEDERSSGVNDEMIAFVKIPTSPSEIARISRKGMPYADRELPKPDMLISEFSSI